MPMPLPRFLKKEPTVPPIEEAVGDVGESPEGLVTMRTTSESVVALSERSIESINSLIARLQKVSDTIKYSIEQIREISK